METYIAVRAFHVRFLVSREDIYKDKREDIDRFLGSGSWESKLFLIGEKGA